MTQPLTSLVDLLREPAIVRDLAGREVHRNASAEGLQESDDWLRLRVGDVVVHLGPLGEATAGPVVRARAILDAEVIGAALVRRGRIVASNRIFDALVGHSPTDRGVALGSLFPPGEVPEAANGSAVEAELLHQDGHHVAIRLALLELTPAERLLLVQDLTAARRAAARIRVLAKADNELRASTDEEQAARRLAAALVPDLADVCYVDLAEADHLRRVGIAHRDPGRTATLDPLGPMGPWGKDAAPEPVLVRDVAASGGRHRSSGDLVHTLRAVGVRSSVVVPIALPSAVWGRITLHVLKDRSAFDEDDLELAQELSARMGIALHRIRLGFELRREGSTFHALVESTPQLIFSANPDGRLGYLNRRWTEYTGMKLDRIRDGGWQELIHPDDIETVREAWRVPPGQVVETRARLRDARGGWRWFLVRAAGAYDDAGELMRWVGSCTDVHEPTRREEHANLMASASAALNSPADPDRALARLAITPVPTFADYCAIYLCEGDRCRLAHLHHRNPGLAGRIRSLHQQHPLDVTSMDRLSEGLRSGRTEILSFRDGEASGGLDDIGRAGVTSMILAPMTVEGELLGILSLASTSNRRAYDEEDRLTADELARRTALFLQNARLYAVAQTEREKAEEANRLKDAFLGMLSHELRTPLSALAGWTQLLVRGRVPPDQVAHAVSVIERNARTLGQLIDDLLDVSRIVTGHLRFTARPVDLAAEVRSAVEAIRPVAAEKGVDLRVRIDDLPPLRGDPERLRQATWNLLSNAVKFTPHGGWVRVTLTEQEHRAALEIADSGIGIEPEFMGRLFDPFRQADSSTTRAHGGLGLGLAIVKHVIDAHGGTIHARSPGAGGGSTFTVLLPLQGAEGPPDAPREDAQAERLAGVVILVVESDPDMLDLLTTLLDSTGATVVHARDASEARATLWRERPDLLLADIRLPGEDGLSLMRSIRRLPPDQGGNVPAVALTAFASDIDRRKALQAGYQAHASKPVVPETLVELLRTVYLGSTRNSDDEDGDS